MKKSALLAVLALGLATAPAFAATKTYQVTGPVIDMSADTITVQKGSEKWEIAKGTAGVPADVKVGSKVTITYTMTADSVASKPMPSSSMMKPVRTMGAAPGGMAMKPSAPTAPVAMQPAISTGAGTSTAAETPSTDK